jgi:hypothetical protein
MHDRAAKPTGAVKSAAAIATEIMILLNIDLRIPQVRPRVEDSVHRYPSEFFGCGFHLHFSKHFARKKVMILLLEENYEN